MTCTGADELKHSRPLPISDGNLPRQPGCKAEREIAQITSRCLLGIDCLFLVSLGAWKLQLQMCQLYCPNILLGVPGCPGAESQA